MNTLQICPPQLLDVATLLWEIHSRRSREVDVIISTTNNSNWAINRSPEIHATSYIWATDLYYCKLTRMCTRQQTAYLLEELCSSSFAANRPNIWKPSNFYDTLYTANINKSLNYFAKSCATCITQLTAFVRRSRSHVLTPLLLSLRHSSSDVIATTAAASTAE